jgi:hypothetical protein
MNARQVLEFFVFGSMGISLLILSVGMVLLALNDRKESKARIEAYRLQALRSRNEIIRLESREKEL